MNYHHLSYPYVSIPWFHKLPFRFLCWLVYRCLSASKLSPTEDHFLCVENFLATTTFNTNKKKWPPPSWFVSSVGRALHRYMYCRGHGFDSHKTRNQALAGWASVIFQVPAFELCTFLPFPHLKQFLLFVVPLILPCLLSYHLFKHFLLKNLRSNQTIVHDNSQLCSWIARLD